MSRPDELRAAIARASQRVAYAEKQIERHAARPSVSVTQFARTHAKLLADLALARNDAEILTRMLEESGSTLVTLKRAARRSCRHNGKTP